MSNKQRERLDDRKDAKDAKKDAVDKANPNTLKDQNQGGDQSKELPGGKDPREEQYPGKYSTQENVTTEEQEAAQAARKEGEVTDAGTPYGSQATRAEQIESQVAAGENPLSPQSTTFNEPHGGGNAMGLVTPPRPEGQKPIVPQGKQMKFDPNTGAPTTAGKRRMRLEEDDGGDDDEEVEVELLRPMNLTDDHGATHAYEAGKVKMPKSHSTHWYTKLHAKQQDAKSQDEEVQPRKKTADK